MVGQKASDEAKIDSDFYAILLRYELHESMENLTEVLYLRIYEERNRIKTTPLYRFEKEYVQGFCCIICYHFPCKRRLIKYETYQQRNKSKYHQPL